MNRLLRCTFAALALLVLAGCTSTQGSAGYRTMPEPAQPGSPAFERDVAYIASVERVARMRGIDVRWVNPPVRRAAAGEPEVQ
ncbi:hypothetical protein QFW77_15595 [Luteimonas sp. RD2P54]|uniref:Uncharacterized protein n=1 Tax=Luteimonas endophytica TaxID=3042023 RepID=A0ABT6JC38_9GAMM|nr:hypothetical protein [Luteimonas endophytica]MDH5824397.1 hypothetical protein [Luteimonas endophytica]